MTLMEVSAVSRRYLWTSKVFWDTDVAHNFQNCVWPVVDYYGQQKWWQEPQEQLYQSAVLCPPHAFTHREDERNPTQAPIEKPKAKRWRNTWLEERGNFLTPEDSRGAAIVLFPVAALFSSSWCFFSVLVGTSCGGVGGKKQCTPVQLKPWMGEDGGESSEMCQEVRG